MNPLAGFVTLSKAIVLAHLRVHGPDLTVSDVRGNDIGTFLVRNIPLFSATPDGQGFRELREAELRDARVTDGGRRIIFSDGRPPIEAIYLSAASLEQAMDALASSKH